MEVCAICDGVVDGPRLGDLHASCVAERLPEDALVALIAAGLLALAPMIIVWAG